VALCPRRRGLRLARVRVAGRLRPGLDAAGRSRHGSHDATVTPGSVRGWLIAAVRWNPLEHLTVAWWDRHVLAADSSDKYTGTHSGLSAPTLLVVLLPLFHVYILRVFRGPSRVSSLAVSQCRSLAFSIICFLCFLHVYVVSHDSCSLSAPSCLVISRVF